MDTKSTVLKTIADLGHKVSAADVAARSGLSLSDCKIALNRIALETRAVLEVSSRGDICYKFYPDLESVYKIVGLKKLLKQIWHVVYEAGFFVLRVSFGLLLIASILTVAIVFAVALCFILFGVGAADAADGDMDLGGDLDFEFFDWDMLGMFFSWSILAGNRTPTSDPMEEYMGVKIDTPDKGFFNNCFGFLFGDGDPNRRLNEEHWHLIAEQIRRNHGVMTAEQFAPYVMDNKIDSRAMLAIMVRFDGTPEVTPKGNIVYSFPSLQVTAAGVNSLQPLPEKIEEKEWKFSKIPTERLHWVFFFAGANLCGAYALNQHLAWFQPLIPYANIIHGMMLYATFFMGFPILREIINSVLNAFIERRNKLRAQAVAALNSPENRFKIQEAQQFASSLFDLRAQQVVYTSNEDILGQDTDGLAAHIDQQLGITAVPLSAAQQVHAHDQQSMQVPPPEQLQLPPAAQIIQTGSAGANMPGFARIPDHLTKNH